MTAEIVNLNKARKAKSRAENQKRAEDNRAKFGRSKVEKNSAILERRKSDATLDGARVEPASLKPGRLDDNHEDLDPGNVS